MILRSYPQWHLYRQDELQTIKGAEFDAEQR
jgi:hypothetical protein